MMKSLIEQGKLFSVSVGISSGNATVDAFPGAWLALSFAQKNFRCCRFVFARATYW